MDCRLLSGELRLLLTTEAQARKLTLTPSASLPPSHNGISISNMEAVAGPAIPALCSAATGRVGSNGISLLPQRRERHNEILGQKTGPNSLPVGESGRRRTRGV